MLQLILPVSLQETLSSVCSVAVTSPCTDRLGTLAARRIIMGCHITDGHCGCFTAKTGPFTPAASSWGVILTGVAVLLDGGSQCVSCFTRHQYWMAKAGQQAND